MQTQIKTYKRAKDYQHDVKRMQRQGWSVVGTATDKKHHLLRKDEQKIVVTYQKGGPQRTAAPTASIKPMSRNAKIGCGIFTVVVMLLILFVIGAIASQASQYAATQDTQATSTAQSQLTSDASTLQLQDTPTDQPTTDTPTPVDQPTHQITQPTPKPTQPPVHTGVNGNPWGYDFNTGSLIYNPPADFCNYFNCISSFWNGSGFVNECSDGTYSLSGGHSGDCSHHGGEWRPLYSH